MRNTTTVLNSHQTKLDKLKVQAANMSLPTSVATDLNNALTLLEEPRYNVPQIHEKLTISKEGKLMLIIPQDEFFGTNPGWFQLRLSWPKIDEYKILVANITINFRVSEGELVLLQPGMGGNDPSAWSNFNTSNIRVQDLIEAGYVADEAKQPILEFCNQKLEQPERPTLTLTPQSNVAIELRPTIVPLVEKQRPGRMYNTDKAPGELANLAIAYIGFQGATVLPLLTPLRDTTTEPILTADELLVKYGVRKARPVANPSINKSDEDMPE